MSIITYAKYDRPYEWNPSRFAGYGEERHYTLPMYNPRPDPAAPDPRYSMIRDRIQESPDLPASRLKAQLMKVTHRNQLSTWASEFIKTPENRAFVKSIIDSIPANRLRWTLRSSYLVNHVLDYSSIERILRGILPRGVDGVLEATDRNPDNFEPIISVLQILPELRHNPKFVRYITQYLDSKERDAIGNGNRYVLKAVANVRSLLTWSRTRHAWLEAVLSTQRERDEHGAASGRYEEE